MTFYFEHFLWIYAQALPKILVCVYALEIFLADY